MITEEESELLKSHGIAPTPQRLAIFRRVHGRKDHPSVDRIFVELRPKIPTLSKTTVYATMQKLADERLIGRVCIEDGEVRYDGSAAFHAHFKCRVCGGLFDIGVREPHDRPFAALPRGFRQEDEQLFYFGLCPKCSGRDATARKTTGETRRKPKATRRNEK